MRLSSSKCLLFYTEVAYGMKSDFMCLEALFQNGCGICEMEASWKNHVIVMVCSLSPLSSVWSPSYPRVGMKMASSSILLLTPSFSWLQPSIPTLFLQSFHMSMYFYHSKRKVTDTLLEHRLHWGLPSDIFTFIILRQAWYSESSEICSQILNLKSSWAAWEFDLSLWNPNLIKQMNCTVLLEVLWWTSLQKQLYNSHESLKPWLTKVVLCIKNYTATGIWLLAFNLPYEGIYRESNATRNNLVNRN